MSDSPDPIRLTALTERYASYSRSAGGLSLVVGGILCVLAFVAGAAFDISGAPRYVLALAPLLWLASKELLRSLYYQRHGAVRERISPRLAKQRRWMLGYLLGMSAWVIGSVAYREGANAMQWPAIGYLLLVVALPFAAMRWFWSVGDFLVGVLLFCQAAVVVGGSHYPWYWIGIALSFAAIAISIGLREHRDYLKIRRDLGLHLGLA